MHVPRHGGVTFTRRPFSSPGYCFPPSLGLYKWKCKRICTPSPNPLHPCFGLKVTGTSNSLISRLKHSVHSIKICAGPTQGALLSVCRQAGLVLPVVQHWRALKFRQKVKPRPNAEVDQWRPNTSGICKWVRPHVFLVQVVNVWKWYYYVIA